MNTLIFLFAFCFCIGVSSATLAIKSIEDCNPGYDYPIKLKMDLSMEGEKQFLDSHSNFPSPIDDSMQLNLTVQVVTGPKPVTIIADVEKDVCTTSHKYLGQFMFDIEKEMGVEPGKCPIPAGDYTMKHFPLKLEKIAIARSLPLGNIQGVVEASNVKDNTVLFCLIVKVTNV